MPGEIDVEINQNGTQEVAPEAKPEVIAAPEVASLKDAAPEVAAPEEEAAPEEAAAPEEPAPEEVAPVEEPAPEEPAPEEPAPEVPAPEVPAPKVAAPKVAAPEVVAAEPAVQQNGIPKKVAMSTSLDTDAVRAAYDDVRSDSSDTEWAVFKFDGQRIVCSGTGANFEKFREQFTENERAFGYIRIQTGDEMSKRQKFLFVTWVGSSVSVLKRAKMSTDKSVIKNIISNFAVELQLENSSEIDLKHFVGELNKAGGANYGTGVRDI